MSIMRSLVLKHIFSFDGSKNMDQWCSVVCYTAYNTLFNTYIYSPSLPLIALRVHERRRRIQVAENFILIFETNHIWKFVVITRGRSLRKAGMNNEMMKWSGRGGGELICPSPIPFPTPKGYQYKWPSRKVPDQSRQNWEACTIIREGFTLSAS